MQNNIKIIIIIAIAAIASLVIIGSSLYLEPVKITHEISIFNVTKGMNYNTEIMTDSICGLDRVGEVRTDFLKVNVVPPGGEDAVNVKYTTIGCLSQTVEIDIYVNDELIVSKTKTKTISNHLFSGIDIDVGDNVKAVLKYTTK